MKKMTLLSAAIVMALFGTVACGGDDDGNGGSGNACEQAGKRTVARLEACEVELPDGGEGNDDGETVECTDELAAQADCVATCNEETDCEILKVIFDPSLLDPNDADQVAAMTEYSECTQACQ